jgi:CheY-like chemotaxis protein
LEVEFDQLQAEVREDLAHSPELAAMRDELRRSPELTEAQAAALAVSLREELARLAEASPQVAVLEAFSRIEARLVEVLDNAGAPSASAAGGRALTRLAHRHGLVSDETLSAVDGLSVLRDLAAHSRADSIGVDRARDYLALADAVLYALREKKPPT